MVQISTHKDFLFHSHMSDLVCTLYLDYMENNPNLQKEEPDFDEWCEKIIEKYNEFKNSIAEII